MQRAGTRKMDRNRPNRIGEEPESQAGEKGDRTFRRPVIADWKNAIWTDSSAVYAEFQQWLPTRKGFFIEPVVMGEKPPLWDRGE